MRRGCSTARTVDISSLALGQPSHCGRGPGRAELGRGVSPQGISVPAGRAHARGVGMRQAAPPSSGARFVAQSQGNELLQQFFVFHACVLGGVREVFIAGNLRIGVGFQEVEATALAQAIVEARIATEV